MSSFLKYMKYPMIRNICGMKTASPLWGSKGFVFLNPGLKPRAKIAMRLRRISPSPLEFIPRTRDGDDIKKTINPQLYLNSQNNLDIKKKNTYSVKNNQTLTARINTNRGIIMNRKLRLSVIGALLFMGAGGASGRVSDLLPEIILDSNIPAPESVIGHAFGTLHTYQWQMEKYLETLERVSDRIAIIRYGTTWEGRPLHLVIISDPQNLSDIESVKRKNLRLTDPRTCAPEEAEKLARELPALVWLGYNIHGNEASGMEAAIQVIYHLAAGQDTLTRRILKEVICLIDPLQNPDGHERYVQEVRSVVTLKSNPDPGDVEHESSWPGGRGNHYLFDLNRDFFLKTQIESQARTRLYHEWMPHVFADLHEMGSAATYFFAPPRPPYNAFVTPELTRWWDRIAENNARFFDRHGWAFYTRETFDAFYPGYGVSYPSMHGAVGMTYEQASARGVSIRRPDGTVLTLHEAAWHHFTASMATLDAVAQRREEKVMDFYRFYERALRDADRDSIREILVKPGDPDLTGKLIGRLLEEGIEVRRAGSDFRNSSAVSYRNPSAKPETFPKGTLVIPVNQPRYRALSAVMAPQAPLPDPSDREGDDDPRFLFYDITGWSLPLTLGVDAFWTRRPSRVETEPVAGTDKKQGGVTGGKAAQVYLVPNRTLGGSLFLADCFAHGIRVRTATRSLKVNGKTWDRGTWVIRVNRNDETVHEKVDSLARVHGLMAEAVHRGLAEGPDLGSPAIVPVKPVTIALLTGPPVSSTGAGALFFLMEREWKIDKTLISANSLADLDGFNVLILPDGRYRDMPETAVEGVKQFVRQGGTVVAAGGGTAWLQSDALKLLSLRSVDEQTDSENQEQTARRTRVPGVIVQVTLDTLHALTMGCVSPSAALVRSGNVLEAVGNTAVVGRYSRAGSLKLSGYLEPESEAALAGKAWMVETASGRGRVVGFLEDPVFRASYDGLAKLFLNAVLMGPSLGR